MFTWVVCSLLVAAEPAPAPPPPTPSAQATQAKTLSELTAVAAANVRGTEVVSSRDIERIVALESTKQLMGCTGKSDCLAEVAGALGARLVLFGELGALDTQSILTLSLYDADAARTVGREVVRGNSVTAISEGIPAAVGALLHPVLGAVTTAPVRVLVMDIQGAAAAEAPPVEAPGTSMLSIAGLSVVGAGAAAGVVGGVLGAFALGSDGDARDAKTTQKDAAALSATRDNQALAANILFVSAGGLAAAGAALWFWGQP